MTTDGRQVTARLAAHGLGPPTSARPVSVPAEQWPAILRELDHERLTGLALAAVTDGAFDVTGHQAAELVARQRAWMDASLRREHESLRLFRGLTDAGLPAVVLKGPTIAHRYYPDPAWRPFRDVDILVRGRDWARACEVVRSLGYRRCRPEPRPGFDVRFGKGALHRSAQDIELDLHRTLVVGPFGLWMDPDELFESTTRLAVGAAELTCLDTTATFVHVAMHAALGASPSNLLVLRDLAQVGASGEVEWDRVVDWTRRWRLVAVVQHALQLVEAELGHVPAAAVRAIARLRPRTGERRALRAHLPPARARGGPARATLRAIRGPSSKAAYVRAMATPSHDFLVARQGHGGLSAYARRWGHAATWLSPVPRR